MISEIDYHANGKINYSEFLAATLHVQTFLTDEKLWALFKQFDTDDSNVITADNILAAMEKWGRKISEQEVKELLEMHDINRNGSISFEEFKFMLLKDTRQSASIKENH